MENLAFYIVDVFAEEKYAGNQLAVIRNARDLSTVEMQKIAKEMHFSETTFLLSDKKRKGGYDVRFFTPENELPFAGHPHSENNMSGRRLKGICPFFFWKDSRQ